MPNQKQRRDAARRHLERQLQARQERDARRKQMTLIGSIVGTLVLIAAIIIIVVATSGTNKKKSNSFAATSGSPSSGASTSSTQSVPQCGNKTEKFTLRRAKGPSVTFMGVTVGGATDLGGKPVVSSHGTKVSKLEVKDLVVGKGKAANESSCVSVQYDGVLYKNGKEFDSSWNRGQTAQFSLTQVVPGFTQGIGGTVGLAPMKAGGRRIIIVPALMGYGNQSSASIPANSDLVFVVDLKSVDS